MKLIQAIIPPQKLEACKEALGAVEVFRLTVSDVQGFGHRTEQAALAGRDLSFELVRKVKLEIGVNEAFVQPTIQALLAATASDDESAAADGKIFILPLADCIRLRTGERGSEAI